jgi:hypothetical protein
VPFETVGNVLYQAPFRGAPHTVSVIIKAALDSQSSMSVRRLAEHICRDLRSKDYLSEILAIYHFVLRNTRYMRDPRTKELVKSPAFVAEQIMSGVTPQLDCDDITALLSALYLSVGCSTRIVTVAFRHLFHQGNRQYTHVLVQALEPKSNTWVTTDPVASEKTPKMLRKVVAARVWPLS